MKSLSVVLIFVIYCLLNIYKGILISTSPMAVHCQHVCKHSHLSVQLYCSTAYKTFLTNQYWRFMPRKTSQKVVHCTLLFMTCYFEGVIIIFCVKFYNKTGCYIEWLLIRTIPTHHPFNEAFTVWWCEGGDRKLLHNISNPLYFYYELLILWWCIILLLSGKLFQTHPCCNTTSCTNVLLT